MLHGIPARPFALRYTFMQQVAMSLRKTSSFLGPWLICFAHAGEGTTALANRLKKKKTAEERAADAERRRQLQV